MKTGIIILLLTCMQAFVRAQPDTVKVAFVSYWSVGDSWRFKVTRINEQWKEGVMTKKDSSQYIGKLEVIDSTENAYTLKWGLENTLLSSLSLTPQLRDRLSKYSSLEIIYNTSEVGDFTGVENWQEVGTTMKEMMNELVREREKESGKDQDGLKKYMESLMAVYGSKQGIEELAMKDLRYIHFPFGIQCVMNEPVLYEEELPNMFGETAIKGDAKLILESADTIQKRCVLVNQMKINSDDAKRLVLEVLKKMGLKDQELNEEIKTARIDIFDNNRFEYFYYPGVPLKIEVERKSVINISNKESWRIDKRIIELTE
ncbi:hypothetical protein [Agriterribacter sp.]|mgnify:CR=1 FL=1|uniref:hypothetical protein n=1 Tax=Agriterribacter sp. TaxID=2821509 RepID=UPI002B9B9D13|nr:hypothetical protein [Agriterribacter sp.]HRO46283.1 hypothetical protein [Agriterribacter sp.]HRQ18524.1 hypothetical protein [Agriterribacter sp.]